MHTGGGISIRNWNASSLKPTTDWRLAILGRSGGSTVTARYTFKRVEAVAYNTTRVVRQNPITVSPAATGRKVYNYTRVEFTGEEWANVSRCGTWHQSPLCNIALGGVVLNLVVSF
jgi:hypothetical protein